MDGVEGVCHPTEDENVSPSTLSSLKRKSLSLITPYSFCVWVLVELRLIASCMHFDGADVITFIHVSERYSSFDRSRSKVSLVNGRPSDGGAINKVRMLVFRSSMFPNTTVPN